MAWSQDVLTAKLNPIIRGWTNYHNSVVSSDVFRTLDHRIWELLWKWAKKINELLSEMKKYTDECREREIPIDPEKVREFEEIYDAIVQEGIEENPPPHPSKDQVKKRGRPAQTKAKNLLDRLYYTRNQF